MGKLSLLKEYLKLVLESPADGPQQPFQLKDPPNTAPKSAFSRSSEYEIVREFPVVPTPEMMQSLGIDETYLEDGLLWGEQVVGIDLTDVYHEKGQRQSMTDPGYPEEYLIEDWEVETLNGVRLSPNDAKALRNYLGELTDAETESLIEQYIDRLPEPDFDDGGYDPW